MSEFQNLLQEELKDPEFKKEWDPHLFHGVRLVSVRNGPQAEERRRDQPCDPGV